MQHTKEYAPPILTVDSVIFQLIDGRLSVLLIQRAKTPFIGSWALPGGYSAAGETTHDAMARILRAKGGVKTGNLKLVEQLYTFDTVAREPREHGVSVNNVMEFDNVETVKRAVEIDAGVSIVPQGTVTQEVTKQTLAAVQLEDGSFYRPLAAIYKKSKVLSPAMKQFLALLKEGQ